MKLHILKGKNPLKVFILLAIFPLVFLYVLTGFLQQTILGLISVPVAQADQVQVITGGGGVESESC
jgi:hypothetical protein